MTLKEAKKAYKKEGIGIQYTASQMERADRFDEREEKRRKELDRERQRVDNKRKRDQKEARERAARQKMLEEGRITVEDTWGKVTASQPRLNKFFGQTAIAPSKRNSQEVIVENKETSRTLQGAGEHAQDKTETCEHSVQGPTAPEKDYLDPKSIVATSGPCGTTPFKSVRGSQQSRHHGQQRDVHDVHCVPSALTELEPAQLNIPSAGSRKLVYDKHPWKGRHNPTPLATRAIPEPENNGPELRSPVPNTMHMKDGSSTYSRAASKHSTNDHSIAAAAVLEYQGLIELDSRTTSEFDLEEDFTDGIDDETLLELCVDQARKGVTPKDPASTNLDSPSSTVRLSSPGSGPEEDRPGKETKEVQQILPKSNGPSDSFTSCFNEIDEDDLIALAEEVEAEISTPSANAKNPEKQTYREAQRRPDLAEPAPAPAPTPLSQTRPINTNPSLSTLGLSTRTEDTSRRKPNPCSSRREPQKFNTSMAPPPPSVGRHAKETNDSAISSVSHHRPHSVPRARLSQQQRKERVLPWNQPSKQHYYHNTNPAHNDDTNNNNDDDFDVLGPSTQALMVALAEQAEAQISSSRGVKSSARG